MKKTKENVPVEVKASFAYTVCSVIQQSLSIITLPLFTRLLTKAQYGQFAVYSSWLAIVMIFTTLNLPYGSYNTALIKYERERDKYISSIQWLCIGLAGIGLVVYIPFSTQLNSIFTLPTELMIIMIIEAMATASLQFWFGKQRFDYKYKGVVFVTLIISVTSPFFAILLVSMTTEKGYARILGYSLINIVAGFIFAGFNLFKGNFAFKKEYVKYALTFNIPLIPYYLSQTVFNQSDRLMINKMCGADKAAVYSVAYSLAVVLVFVLNAINNSYVPWFYKKLKTGAVQENGKISLMIAALMAFLLMGVIVFAPEIITIMAGRKYVEAVGVVPPVAMSLLLLFYAQLFINVELFFEKKTMMVISTLFAAALNIVLNAIFIKSMGYIAAGYTTLASYIVFAAANYFSCKKILQNEEIDKPVFDIKGMIILFILMFTCATIAGTLYQVLVARIVIVVIVITITILFRKKIIGLFKSIKIQIEDD